MDSEKYCQISYLAEKILLLIIGEEEYLEYKINSTKNNIEKYKEIPTLLPYYISKLISLLEENEDEIEKFYEQYWDYSGVKKLYIEKCIEKEQYDSALSVINANIDIFDEYDLHYKLRDIYKAQGDIEEYKNQLYLILYKYNYANIEIFKELKEIYETEEWIQIRENIFERLKNFDELHELFYHEKMYDRLINWIQLSGKVYTITYYAEELKNLYPK